MIIGITGVSGKLGRATVSALKSRATDCEIVGLARSPEHAADLGVTIRPFDYDAPETLAAALARVDRLLLISSSENGRRGVQHRAVIEAATQAGVRLFAYTSILHADTSPIGLAAEHRETEADLRASKLPWVILRNSWYSENFMGAVPHALETGAYIGATGGAQITAAARADYAEAAARVLLDKGHAGRIYELSGDTPFTLFDLCSEVSQQSGREISYADMTPDAYARSLQEGGMGSDLAAFLAGIDAALAQGSLYDVSGDLSRLIGRPTTPLSKVISNTLADHRRDKE